MLQKQPPLRQRRSTQRSLRKSGSPNSRGTAVATLSGGPRAQSADLLLAYLLACLLACESLATASPLRFIKRTLSPMVIAVYSIRLPDTIAPRKRVTTPNAPAHHPLRKSSVTVPSARISSSCAASRHVSPIASTSQRCIDGSASKRSA